MNIVYYLDAFPKLSESFILNEIYELEQMGHNVAVCARKRPNERIVHKEFNELKIPIKYIGIFSYSDVAELLSPSAVHPRILKNIFHPGSPKAYLKNLIRSKKCIEFVNSLNWDPEHFHSHFATISKFGAQYTASYYRVPFTITTHAIDLYGGIVGKYTSNLLQRAERIITISKYNRRSIRENFAAKTPIDVVRAGIRPEKFSPKKSAQPTRVLTICRFVEKKGLQFAIKGVSVAAERIPELEYHIIGSGPLKNELMRKAKRLGIEDNTVFLDNVDDEQLVSELDEARCFLLPCIVTSSGNRDGIPVSLIEAMAMKTPPISTSISGIPELIDHEKNGLLVEPRSGEAIAEALITILKEESKWSVYAERAREKVLDEFNIKNEVTKLESTFENAHG